MAPERVLSWQDRESGLRAVLVLDSTALGPAAGGVRTWRYASTAEARDDAARLARTMTLKCALAGLDAGGGKCAVIDHAGLDRPAAFRRLGRLVEQLDGDFRTAGDLGTTAEDLAAMAETCRFVHADAGALADAVARGVLRCAEACVEREGGRSSLCGSRVAVQGCGSIGAAVARAFAAAGAHLLVADLDRRRAEDLGAELGAQVVAASEILTAEVDLVVPCAAGGAITEEVARGLRARAVCGPANHLLASAGAGRILLERGIAQVPDLLASAGAVIDGIGRTVMGLADRAPLIDALGERAREVLAESRATGELPDGVAEKWALARIRALGGSGRSESEE